MLIAPAYDESPVSLPLHVELFVRPTIRSRRIDTKQRHPNLLDRSYRLQINRGDPMMRLFETMPIGNNFLFTIGYQAIASRGFMASGDRTLFVQGDEGLPETFRYIFTELPFNRALGITKDDVDRLIPYLLDDLKTRSVLKKNMAAGQKADDILFS